MNFLGLKGLSDWSVIMVLDVIDGCLSQTPFAIYKWLSFGIFSGQIFSGSGLWLLLCITLILVKCCYKQYDLKSRFLPEIPISTIHF